jgi:hypothetical protein
MAGCSGNTGTQAGRSATAKQGTRMRAHTPGGAVVTTTATPAVRAPARAVMLPKAGNACPGAGIAQTVIGADLQQ